MNVNAIGIQSQNHDKSIKFGETINPPNIVQTEQKKDTMELSKKEMEPERSLTSKKFAVVIGGPFIGSLVNGNIAKALIYLGAGFVSLVTFEGGRMMKNKAVSALGLLGGAATFIIGAFDSVKNVKPDQE